MSAHALFSPSSAHRWMRCPGALAMEAPFPESDTDYSREGTAAHELASWTLEDGRNIASAYAGRLATNGVEITDDMCEYIQGYVDTILQRVKDLSLGGAVTVDLMVEQRVDYERFVGQPDSFGTSDVIIAATYKDGSTLIDVHDLKYGYRTVYAKENEQMMTYALGAIATYDILYPNITRASMTIHMPRKRFEDSWECGIEELLAFADRQRAAAYLAAGTIEAAAEKGPGAIDGTLRPGAKQCEWCKAAGTCPAYRSFVEATVAMDFDDLPPEKVEVEKAAGRSTMQTLEQNLTFVPMIEAWCKAQRAELERRLFAGEKSSLFKLVKGKMGNRAWVNKPEAEQILKDMRFRVEEIYKMELITPPAAEKLIAKKHPRRWARLKKLIGQAEGGISVAPMDDKRDPVEPNQAAPDDFADLPPEEGDDLC